eukprot:1634715-Pyramimonas_sp.AAC.2
MPITCMRRALLAAGRRVRGAFARLLRARRVTTARDVTECTIAERNIVQSQLFNTFCACLRCMSPE